MHSYIACMWYIYIYLFIYLVIYIYTYIFTRYFKHIKTYSSLGMQIHGQGTSWPQNSGTAWWTGRTLIKNTNLGLPLVTWAHCWSLLDVLSTPWLAHTTLQTFAGPSEPLCPGPILGPSFFCLWYNMCSQEASPPCPSVSTLCSEEKGGVLSTKRLPGQHQYHPASVSVLVAWASFPFHPQLLALNWAHCWSLSHMSLTTWAHCWSLLLMSFATWAHCWSLLHLVVVLY